MSQGVVARARVGAREAVSIVAVVVAAAGLGFVGAIDLQWAAVAVAAAIGLVLIAARPLWIAVAAVPATFLVTRVGPDGAITHSDAVLTVAALLALPALAGSQELKRLSPALRAMAFYLGALTASVLANQSLRTDLELLHRLVLIGGSLVVGAWLVREGGVRAALRLLVVLALVFSLAAIVTSLQSGFAPAYPLGFHKNFVGSVAATTFLVLLAAPREVAIGTRVRIAALVVLAGGMVATQSRGALLGAALGVLIWFFRSFSDRTSKTWLLGLAAVVVFAGFAIQSVRAQLADEASVNTNSYGVRLRVEARTHEIWQSSPVVGVGMKYFFTGEYGSDAQASTNAINNELAESGLVGAVGFVIFQGALIVLLYRRNDPLATAALAVVSARLMHGMVDIYWSAGVSSLPFLIAGMALARPVSSSPEDRAAQRRVRRRVTAEG